MCEHWFALEHITRSSDDICVVKMITSGDPVDGVTQTSTKVDMVSCFLVLVVSLPPEEQNLWLPNQVVHDPDTWTTPHLLQLQREYDILVDKYGWSVQKMFTVKDPSDPPSDILLLSPLKWLYKANVRIQELPQPGDSRPVLSPSQHTWTDHEKLGTFENKHWKV